VLNRANTKSNTGPICTAFVSDLYFRKVRPGCRTKASPSRQPSRKTRQSAQVFEGMTTSQSPNLNVPGKVSLWTAIAGVVLSCVLAVVLLTKEHQRPEPDFERLREWPNALCGVLFVMLDLVALGCGIRARHTVAGKKGLRLSLCAWIPMVAMWSFSGGTFFMLILLLCNRVAPLKPDPEACPPEPQALR